MPEVSVVIVCMGGPQKHLEACLEGLRRYTSVSYEVLVVAYLWSDQDKGAFAEAHPSVTLIRSDETRGFSENNNLALPLAKGRFCWILNDDTRLSSPVLDALVAQFDHLPANAAAISPCIRFADGRIQTCGRTPWTSWRYARHYLHLVDEASEEGRYPRIRSHPRLREREGPDAEGIGRGRSEAETIRGDLPSSEVFQTYTLNGACFLIKTEVFKLAGWFDGRFFFTPEDIALGHKLNEMGYTVWVDPSVSITHLAGGSVSSMEYAIKPARVRGSLLFYGEPLWLRCFVWCFEALRVLKYAFLPATERNKLMSRTARNVMRTAFSKSSPKELFIRFSHE